MGEEVESCRGEERGEEERGEDTDEEGTTMRVERGGRKQKEGGQMETEMKREGNKGVQQREKRK